MTQDEIIEMAIQGHAGTRDAIRWAINQVVKAEREECAKQDAVAWMVYTQEGQSVYVTDNPTDIQEGQRALPLYTKAQHD